ncbi:MAG: Stp1/IreP family PP2C-type Ser/Thr phosphatase [Lachnospiraceae bacterium]|jgi:protein phosphatase|nr:Stp1/IreP family PP2C-type Ser/Thr phosphatase [Lachnospiraceae bacterium]MCR5346079.1 Stp1/IreP family PP2C-type Ser/Thr phosphatase [Lachnospiraceae bacterium]
MKTHALTDRGLERPENQDYLFTSELSVGNLPNLFIVADGMGGHAGGKLASTTATKAFVKSVQKSTSEDVNEILTCAVTKANEEVIKKAKKSELEGMGTTLVAATVIEDKLYVANVGDSRLYVITAGEIKQVTKDHSLVEEMVRLGELEPSKARTHEKKNVITRAIGVADEVKADIFKVSLKEEQTILLCTDGLTNMVTDDDIRKIVVTGRDVIEKAENLIGEANKNGGKDNITVVLIEP